MVTFRAQAVFAAVATLSLGTWGCATKKHVREAIAPVQQQVNQVQKDTSANKTAIGDLDRNVASVDEKAQEAGRRAREAAEAAERANNAAQQAGTKADAASNMAQTAITNVNQVSQTLQTSLQNLDNYTLANTVKVYFKVGQANLTQEGKDSLDQSVSSANGMRNIVVEVEGFADRTGSKAYNLELARRRADAVVHYLTVEKNIPLRNVRELGVGSDFPNAENKTRADRKENRRVDVKIYALNLTGQPNMSGNSDRMSNPPQAPAKQTPDQNPDKEK